MSVPAQIAYIGLGSNLENPQSQVRRALRELNELKGNSLLQASSLYVSKPLGPADQPDYVNAVAEVSTLLSPFELLDALQTIEELHGRVRLQHWGPRTIDLDILLFGDQHIQSNRLCVPHQHMHKRSFVLQPLAEIAPGIRIPGHAGLPALLAQCDDMGLHRLPI